MPVQHMEGSVNVIRYLKWESLVVLVDSVNFVHSTPIALITDALVFLISCHGTQITM